MSATQLEIFNQGGLFRITEIKFWLLEAKSYYEKVKKINSVLYLHEIEGELIRLPPISIIYTEDEMFLDLYEGLENLVFLQQREEYFQKAILEYQSIKNKSDEVNKWLLKYNGIWEMDYTCFLIDYLDYSESTTHLKLFLYKQKSEIFIHRDDFKYTIKFLELFDELKY